jgi:hypothetical protein
MTERAHARGTIQVKTYEPTTYDEHAGAPALVEIHVVEEFSGDVAGSGEVRFLQHRWRMARLRSAGSSA